MKPELATDELLCQRFDETRKLLEKNLKITLVAKPLIFRYPEEGYEGPTGLEEVRDLVQNELSERKQAELSRQLISEFDLLAADFHTRARSCT